jgi:hypothetical protein
MDNPWDVLPSYWTEFIAAVAGAGASASESPSLGAVLKGLFRK